MYDGKTVSVKLECRNHLMKYAIGRFGQNIKTEIARDDTFYAYPEVALISNSYSCLFKFACDIILLSPENAMEEYIKKLN